MNRLDILCQKHVNSDFFVIQHVYQSFRRERNSQLRFFCNCCYCCIVYVFFLCLYSILLYIFRVALASFVLFVIAIKKEWKSEKGRMIRKRDHTRWCITHKKAFFFNKKKKRARECEREWGREKICKKNIRKESSVNRYL